MDEMDDFEYGSDPYDSIPFGDAQRFEDEQVARDLDAGEGRPDYDSESDDVLDAHYASAEKADEARMGARLVRAILKCQDSGHPSHREDDQLAVAILRDARRERNLRAAFR